MTVQKRKQLGDMAGAVLLFEGCSRIVANVGLHQLNETIIPFPIQVENVQLRVPAPAVRNVRTCQPELSGIHVRAAFLDALEFDTEHFLNKRQM